MVGGRPSGRYIWGKPFGMGLLGEICIKPCGERRLSRGGRCGCNRGGRCRIRKEGLQAERVVRVVGGLLHRQAERLKGSSRRVEWL